MITIPVNKYYGNPSYYSVMPNEIFDALELASLKDEPTASVPKDLILKMEQDHTDKMASYKASEQ